MGQKEIIKMMSDGWRLEPSKNYNGKIIRSYFLCKKGEKQEHNVSNKIRNTLEEKGIIDRNNDLVILSPSYLRAVEEKILKFPSARQPK